VGVDFGRDPNFDHELQELTLLAKSAGDDPVACVLARRSAPDAALFVGSGKADEIKTLVQLHDAQGVIFDQALSAAQQRNLERLLGVAVSDRTALILDIFADRARSHDGKLQVELARMQYIATRLVRRWNHLERQQGGIGGRGGPGEAQIELDRRMLDERIKQLKAKLVKVQRQRDTQRRSRVRSGALRVSIVGYTNAGKSTLFNALVKAKAYAADQLFATLDTTTRSMWLAQAGQSIVLSDTVGFIRNLPHKLVDAFAATLQEAMDADVLLHVVDASSEHHLEQMESVDKVLAEIDADHIQQILVFNKLDRMEASKQPRAAVDSVPRPTGGDALGRVPRVFVSAQDGLGLDALRDLLGELASGGSQGTKEPFSVGS
jgi:GTPase